MRKAIFLSTIFTVASLAAISSDDYPMLNQEAQDQQMQDQRLQDQKLQDQRLQNQRLDNRRQDQRVQDRRLEQQRLQNKRLVAEADAPAPAPAVTLEEARPVAAMKDRFTTTEDHKLANLVRAKIIEVAGDPSSANDIILVIDNGDVKLVGKVSSDDFRTRISQAVQQMKGVKSVHNRLEVSKKK